MTVTQTGQGNPVDRAPDVWKVPQRNKNFTGREELLARLRSGLVDQITAVVPHALHGLGGVGKTQMAVEFAHRFRGDYELVWWVPSDQPVLVRAALASLAPKLGLPPAATSGIEDAASAVLDSLRKGEPYAKWLLIFDNADQPEDLKELIPQGPGHVLITSRNHRWDSVVDTVAIDVFTRDESVTFLAKRLPNIRKADADRLAEALGDLPLALEQAGALQAESGMPVSEYLKLLNERTSQLLDEGRPTEYPASMTAAWALSVTKLGERLPEAVELLRCCAFFGPEPIPRDVFSQPQVALGPQLVGLLSDPITLSRAIAELGRYALARVDTMTRTIQVHRLIQALVRDALPVAEQDRIRHEVHLLLVGLAPANPDSPVTWNRYTELLGHIDPAGVAKCHEDSVRGLALNVVRYLYASSDYGSARSFVNQFIELWSSVSGKDNIFVLTARRLLGNILRELGEYREAYDLDVETLAGVSAASEEEEQLAVRMLPGIAADLRGRGDLLGARQRDEEALDRYQALFGETDARTLTQMNNLALDLGLSSDYKGAREMHERAYLGMLSRRDGIDKASMLSALSGLARAVRLCGDYPEACDLGEEAYAYGIAELGPDHSWTLRAGKDLSIACRRAGDFHRAHEVALDVHGRYVRLFDLDHPDTLAAAMCLANIRRTMGDLQSAVELAADTVRRYPRVYGPEHPYNHACVGNLALLTRVHGDPARARELNEGALAGLEAKLTRDHHYSLTVATNLASDLAALGELEAAVRLGRGTQRRLRAVLGEDHPMALACSANLAADLRAAGETDEADELFEDIRKRYERTLGLDHPDAVVAMEGRHLDFDFDPPPI